MKQLNINQLRKLLGIYKRDLEFVNADEMNWNHNQGSKTPPNTGALRGYALLKCKDHQAYLNHILYDMFDGIEELVPETELTFSLMALATIEAILLSTGIYSWNGIQAVRKKVINE